MAKKKRWSFGKNKHVNGSKLVEHTIYLERDFKTNDPPRAKCTCTWQTEVSSNLMELGKQAKAHSIETGHNLRIH